MDQAELEARIAALEAQTTPWLASRWAELKTSPQIAVIGAALGAAAALVVRHFV